MSVDFYIRLTLAVYRVTELFPKEELLRQNIRDLANEILICLIGNGQKKCSAKIEALSRLFDSAEKQRLADSRNFSVLRREYAKIAILAEKQAKTRPVKTVEKPLKTQNRKQIILAKLQENGKIKIGDLTKIFPDINRRTLLRDLETFSQDGLIVKNGNGRGACYTLRNATL